MIAREADPLEARWRGPEKMSDDARRIRTAVDEIAEQDQQLGALEACSVDGDLAFERDQFLISPMDVADGIDDGILEIDFDTLPSRRFGPPAETM